MAERQIDKLRREDWNGFLKEFQGESDRAAAILGAAFLDEQFRFLLETFLIDDSESKNLLDTSLRGIAVRAKAAFCLGFLSPLEYRDTGRIINIRNRFAHRLHGLTFKDPEIIAQCDVLELPLKILPTNWKVASRDKYVVSTQQISTWVALRRLAIRSDRRKIQSGPTYPGRATHNV
jgi:DNA-binding MltR family transcriptional regulator